MKASSKVAIAVGLAIVIVLISARRTQNVLIESFSWTLDVDIVRYSLRVENKSKGNLEALLLLIAETKSEGHDGITIHPRGAKRVDVVLAPGEMKEISGEFRLNRRSDSHLVVYPLIEKKPNKAPEPTTKAVTSLTFGKKICR